MTQPIPSAEQSSSRRKTNQKILLVVAFVLVAAVSCGVGTGMGSTKTVVTGAKPAPTVTVTATVTASATSTAAAKVAATPKPKATFDDGGGDVKAIVGEDIPAGTWTVHNASSDCYWEITRDGHPSDIVDNNIGGGTQRVQLKNGQDFESQGCGVWTKS